MAGPGSTGSGTESAHASDPVEAAFERPGVRMVYTRSGTETGRSYVLVHGIGMGHRVFRGLADRLGETGVVYAVDLPGFGDSPEPDRAMPMSASGDLIAEFVAHLGLDDAVLVGHSMGTQVVTEAVVRHPQISRRVVLIAPTVNSAERSAGRQAWRLLQDLAIESPAVLAIGLVQYLKAGPRWFFAKLGQMLEHRIEDALPRLEADTLVIRGADDYVCPVDWCARVVALLPHPAGLRELPGHGHEAMIRRPDPVAAMIAEHAARP